MSPPHPEDVNTLKARSVIFAFFEVIFLLVDKFMSMKLHFADAGEERDGRRSVVAVY